MKKSNLKKGGKSSAILQKSIPSSLLKLNEKLKSADIDIITDVIPVDIKQNTICKNVKFDSYIEINTKEAYEYCDKIINELVNKDILINFLDNKCHLNDNYCSPIIIGGGETILQSTTAADIEMLKEYCKTYATIINTKEEDVVLKIIGGKEEEVKVNLSNLSDKHRESYEFLDDKLKNICTIIKNNYKENIKHYDIMFIKYDVDNADKLLEINERINLFQNSLIYYDYNEDIILDYQKEQLQLYEINRKEINSFIFEQLIYINSLPPEKKRVLIDYTRLKSFTLYQEYCKDETPDKLEFLNNFKRIFSSEGDDAIILNMGNAFADYIIKMYEVMRKVSFSDKDTFLKKSYKDNADEIYKSITREEWIYILDYYIIDLNLLILGAPAVTHEFICFRGVSFDYIKPAAVDLNKQIVFSSKRSSSVSFNYKAAKKYYDMGIEPDKKTIYKVLIKKGCKLLFITPLAGKEIVNEMELILPSNHSFMSVGQNKWQVLKTYNNINNLNNICIDINDGIRSKNLILLTPEETSRLNALEPILRLEQTINV